MVLPLLLLLASCTAGPLTPLTVVGSVTVLTSQCSQWDSQCEFYSHCEVFCKRPHISYTLLEKTHIAVLCNSSTKSNQSKLSKY